MKKDPQTVCGFIAEAREFAIGIIDAASILINETNDLRMTTAIRHAVIETATALADAKHEMMHEIVRSEELIQWNESDPRIDAMLKGIHERMSDTQALVKRLIRRSNEAVGSGEADSQLILVLDELGLNIGDLPGLSTSAQPTTVEPRLGTTSAPDFHDLLVSDRYRREDEILLEHFTKSEEDLRDIVTSIIFEDQGFVVFRVIDDEYRYADSDYWNPSYSITLLVIEPADREALFTSFLENAAGTEIERRALLVAALQAALPKQFCKGLLDSNGIPFREFHNTICTS
jgi:hypothetical protein